MENFGREVKFLMRKLLENIPLYFDKNLILNSDGRRLLSQLLRYLLYEHHEYRYIIKEVRKNPTIENVVKLAKIALSPNEVEDLLNIYFKGIYCYKINEYSI